MDKGPCKSFSMLILNLEMGATALGKQNKFASCLSKGQAEMQGFFKPWVGHSYNTHHKLLKQKLFLFTLFSWKFLTFTLHTFVLTQMCRSPSPKLSHAYSPVIPKSTLGKGERTQAFQDFWWVIVRCRGSSDYVASQEVKSFKQCIV